MDTLLNIIIWGFILFCIIAVIVSFNDGKNEKIKERNELYSAQKAPPQLYSGGDYPESRNADGAPSIPIDPK